MGESSSTLNCHRIFCSLRLLMINQLHLILDVLSDKHFFLLLVNFFYLISFTTTCIGLRPWGFNLFGVLRFLFFFKAKISKVILGIFSVIIPSEMVSIVFLLPKPSLIPEDAWWCPSHY